jgi:hypothetical protein
MVWWLAVQCPLTPAMTPARRRTLCTRKGAACAWSGLRWAMPRASPLQTSPKVHPWASRVPVGMPHMHKPLPSPLRLRQSRGTLLGSWGSCAV